MRLTAVRVRMCVRCCGLLLLQAPDMKLDGAGSPLFPGLPPLGGMGMPGMPFAPPADGSQGGEQCCIM